MDATEEKIRPKGGGEVVKVCREMLAKLRMIAAARRVPMGDLIKEYAGARIDAEYKAVLKEKARKVK